MKPDLMLQPLPPGKLPAWLLEKVLPGTADPSVIVGPGLGRDAAAITVGDRVVVAKNDPITFASEGGATHLVEVNANDVACMGATPRWLLVTALLPHGVTPADVLNQFAELREACRHRSVDLIGGHSEIVLGLERPILVGMMLGETARGALVEPGKARPGDVLLLTKGLAIEGAALLARERRDRLIPLIGEDNVRAAADLMRDPGISIVRDADLALAAGGVTALHDPTEGGFATAVRELAAASKLGAEINADALPILPETRAVADALGLDPLGLLASGALLIAAAPDAVSGMCRAIESAGIPVSVVGKLTGNPASFTLHSDQGELDLAFVCRRRGRPRAHPAWRAVGACMILLVSSSNARVGLHDGMAVLRDGGSAIDAVVATIRRVEANPDDHSVGYGGLPNLLRRGRARRQHHGRPHLGVRRRRRPQGPPGRHRPRPHRHGQAAARPDRRRRRPAARRRNRPAREGPAHRGSRGDLAVPHGRGRATAPTDARCASSPAA